MAKRASGNAGAAILPQAVRAERYGTLQSLFPASVRVP